MVSRAGVGLTLAAWARPFADGAFSLFFPADCRICREPLVRATRLPVCQDCRDSVVPPPGEFCFICGERIVIFSPTEFRTEAEPCLLCRRAAPAYARAVAYGAFEDTLRETIHLLKYDCAHPAAKFLGDRLSIALAQLSPPDASGWLVIPVRLHVRKLRQRGFNQSELIARAACRRSPVVVSLNAKCLVRQRETASQAGLTRPQRRENLRGAFAVRDADAVRGRNVLMIDDVFTTGTTISECARVLRRAGAASVYAARVARALKADRIGSWKISEAKAA